MDDARRARTFKVGPWPLGIANLPTEDALPRNDFATRPIALREADNIDFDTAGVPRRRRGTERFFAGTLSHSLWADARFPFALFVDDGLLHAVEPTGQAGSTGHAVSNLPLSYAMVGDRVYFSNRQASGMLGMDLQVHPWAPEHPSGQPVLADVSGYGLEAGQYQVAVTFVDALGRESGSTLAAHIDLPTAGRGINLLGLPQPLTAVQVNIYMTDANDQVLRLHSSLAAGAAPPVLGQAATGVKLATQHLEPLPPGQIVRLFNGRQLVASGRVLRWSAPLRYGMTDMSKMAVRFNDEITLVEPASVEGRNSGLFVAAGTRTYWLSGADPESWDMSFKRSAGAIAGSACRVPGPALGVDTPEDVPVWLGADGQWCLGGADGDISTPKAGMAVVDGADHAATLFRAQGGLQQVVASLRAPRPRGLQVTDRAVAHVIHEDAP